MSGRVVVLTGGGTAGHVTPNLALLPVLRERGWEVVYVGSRDGIERRLATEAGLAYRGVHSGKLRRYASWENLVDPFRIALGVVEAFFVLRRIRPHAVFSKGGFVAVPVVVGAWLNRVPVVAHESDRTPGLANRLCFPLASRIGLSFAETAELVDAAKAVHTGAPVRPALLAGDRSRGQAAFGLDPARRTVFVFGGSQGAVAVNDLVRGGLDDWPTDWQALHVCGPGHLDASLEGRPGYRQFEYLDAEFADALACADVVVSRGGANSLAELMALRKPAVVIPLPTSASRGDQIENARLFAERGYGIDAPQEGLDPLLLIDRVREALQKAPDLVAAMERDQAADPAARIVDLIEEVARAGSEGRP